jgi:predicted MFS family arabinose efflux permease
LNVFLVTNQHWSQASIWLVTLVGGWLGLVVQRFVGAVIDITRAKVALIIVALFVLAMTATLALNKLDPRTLRMLRGAERSIERWRVLIRALLA